MTKYLFVFLGTFLFQTAAFALTSNDFEAELQLLEKNELLLEETQMKAVQELSTNETPVEDSVTLGLASTKSAVPKEKLAPITQESLIAPQKTRRIRSR